ncbi:MAG: hypothetical protein QF775_01290 [archaeon]|jgi:hypothetical protein|nr:hypothetical protein [Euryarchaeota archaeon]MDP6704100.1 hypothetical protein [archaeon]|tara:strand:+ start:65471 stop:65770 length:300 start_codon:yes stop_codon:yes gene_type:complete
MGKRRTQKEIEEYCNFLSAHIASKEFGVAINYFESLNSSLKEAEKYISGKDIEEINELKLPLVNALHHTYNSSEEKQQSCGECFEDIFSKIKEVFNIDK